MVAETVDELEPADDIAHTPRRVSKRILLGIAGSVYLASTLKNPNQQRQHSLLDAASNEISNKRLQDEMDASRQYTEENYRVF